MKKFLLSPAAILIALVFISNPASAQQYKLKQVSNMMGMKTESTIYVKGSRKRTEGGGIMGMGADLVTIQQCDLQRYIKINDKKKMYFIEPFAKENEEVIDEDVTPAPKLKPVVTPKEKPVVVDTKKGGTITASYSINDTGDRKKIYGFTARHVWTVRRMMPSPDACTMKDSMMIKTDGWYIDLPQFNCPVQYRPARPPMRPQSGRPGERPVPNEKPDCMDHFITHRSGKGKLGFPLSETTTMKMGGTGAKMNEFETSIETLDFSMAKLDSMLFEIPPGYTEAKDEAELQDKMDMNDMIRNAMNKAKENMPPVVNIEMKKANVIRIGVYAPTGDDQVQPFLLQQHIVSTLTGGTIEAIAIASEEEAGKFKCDYTLTTAFTKLKSANKLGGILKAIKNADPNVTGSYNIQASLVLKALADGSEKAKQKVDGKYEGKVDDAAGKALDEGCTEVLKVLK